MQMNYNDVFSVCLCRSPIGSSWRGRVKEPPVILNVVFVLVDVILEGKTPTASPFLFSLTHDGQKGIKRKGR